MIRKSPEEWFEHCLNKGSSGDQVYDILRDWKEEIASRDSRILSDGWRVGLPSEYGYYLVYQYGTKEFDGEFAVIIFDPDLLDHWNENVNNWMPLPKPPVR